MEEIEQALRDIIPVLEQLAKVSGFTEWAMFIVTLLVGMGVGGGAIWFTHKLSNSSKNDISKVQRAASAALTQIKKVSETIEENHRLIVKELFSPLNKLIEYAVKEEKPELVDTTKKKIRKAVPGMSEDEAAGVATSVVVATSTSLADSLKLKLAGFFPDAFPSGGGFLPGYLGKGTQLGGALKPPQEDE